MPRVGTGRRPLPPVGAVGVASDSAPVGRSCYSIAVVKPDTSNVRAVSALAARTAGWMVRARASAAVCTSTLMRSASGTTQEGRVCAHDIASARE